MDLSEETVKANAMLAGLGRTRRVLLGDTLLSGFSPDEIEVIFAHEIGHHVFHHIRKMIDQIAGKEARYSDAAGTGSVGTTWLLPATLAIVLPSIPNRHYLSAVKNLTIKCFDNTDSSAHASE